VHLQNDGRLHLRRLAGRGFLLFRRFSLQFSKFIQVAKNTCNGKLKSMVIARDQMDSSYLGAFAGCWSAVAFVFVVSPAVSFCIFDDYCYSF